MRWRTWRLISIAVIVAGATVGCPRENAPGSLPAAPADALSRYSRVQGEYLVTVAAGSDIKVVLELYGRFGIKGSKDLGSNVFLVTVTEDPGPETMEKLGAGSAHIKAVQPNYVYRTQ